jgi:hypothetical protein
LLPCLQGQPRQAREDPHKGASAPKADLRECWRSCAEAALPPAIRGAAVATAARRPRLKGHSYISRGLNARRRRPMGAWAPLVAASPASAMAPNGMRLRRLSRIAAPPHSCAPETSRCLVVRTERSSRLRPAQHVCELTLLAPLDASLIHRNDPQCPHSHDTAA